MQYCCICLYPIWEFTRFTEEYSHEGHGEVEPLPQASEGDKGLTRETTRGHLAVGLLILPWWTLTHESTSETIHAYATVLANARYTSA